MTWSREKRPEAVVIMVALDSASWADQKHSDAAKRVINDLWRKGLLRYTVLPPKIVEMLSRKNLSSYQRHIKKMVEEVSQ